MNWNQYDRDLPIPTTLGEIAAREDRIYELLRLIRKANAFADIHKLSAELAALTAEFAVRED